MTNYVRINLANASVASDPGPLPAALRGLADASLADLPAALDPVPADFAGVGYWPTAIIDAEYDSLTEILDNGFAFAVDDETRTVAAERLARPMTADELAAISPPTEAEVTAERDRRIDGGVTFEGKVYQSRATDRENIAGAAQLAFMAMVSDGAMAGDLRWADPDNDFVWIAEDNSLVPMDAPTVIEFAKTAAARKQPLTMVARAIKDMDPIPAGFRDDAYWP